MGLCSSLARDYGRTTNKSENTFTRILAMSSFPVGVEQAKCYNRFLLRIAQITICQSEDWLLSGICSPIFMFEIVHSVTYFWKQLWGALKFQYVQKNIFLKSLNSLDFPGRAAADGFGEILILLHVEYLLHHLMSKHIPPMGDLDHEDAEIRCMLPTLRSFSSFSIWRD